MKLVNYDYGLDIDFIDDSIQVLYMESKLQFRNFVFQLINQGKSEDDGFVLSEAEKDLPFNKEVEVILNPLDIDLNNKKSISKLYEHMNNILGSFEEEKEDLRFLSASLVSELVSSMNYMGLTYDIYSINWTDFFKLFNLAFDDNELTIIEKIIEYIKISKVYLRNHLLIFVDLKKYLTDEELLQIYETALAYKLNLLLIETDQHKQLLHEKIRIFDKDLCLIEL